MRINVNSLRTRRVPEPAMNHTPLRGGVYSHVSRLDHAYNLETFGHISRRHHGIGVQFPYVLLRGQSVRGRR